MSPFETALERTLGFEGGLADNSADRGGRTEYGITQATYDSWRTTTGQPQQSVDRITDDEVKAIYLADYWMPCHCDSLPERLASVVFDMAVNSGVWSAKLALQRACHVQADGLIGPETIHAANADPDQIAVDFLKQRAGLISEIVQGKPSQSVFLHGWINRLIDQAWRVA